jgi:fucose 4-O-acetylase-like acetyltransferase
MNVKETKALKHVPALLIKFIMLAVVLEIVLLLLTSLTFGSILWIALVLTAVAYIVGDMIILPATNNIVATIADFIIALFLIYLFNFFWNTNRISFLSAVAAAAVIGVGEWFFHKMIDRKVDNHEE